jgi:hypothetical protein
MLQWFKYISGLKGFQLLLKMEKFYFDGFHFFKNKCSIVRVELLECCLSLKEHSRHSSLTVSFLPLHNTFCGKEMEVDIERLKTMQILSGKQR